MTFIPRPVTLADVQAAMKAGGYDTCSVVDTCKFFGMPSDAQSRGKYYNDFQLEKKLGPYQRTAPQNILLKNCLVHAQLQDPKGDSVLQRAVKFLKPKAQTMALKRVTRATLSALLVTAGICTGTAAPFVTCIVVNLFWDGPSLN